MIFSFLDHLWCKSHLISPVIIYWIGDKSITSLLLFQLQYFPIFSVTYFPVNKQFLAGWLICESKLKIYSFLSQSIIFSVKFKGQLFIPRVSALCWSEKIRIIFFTFPSFIYGIFIFLSAKFSFFLKIFL